MAALAVALAVPTSGHALQIQTLVSLGVGSFPSPTGTDSDFDTKTSNAAGPISSVGAAATGFDGTTAQWTGIASATASSTSLGVSTGLSLTDFDADVRGLINQTAIARYDSFYMVGPTALATLYLSPIFDLSGEISATPGVPARITMNMEFFSTSGNHVDSLFDASAPSDGSTLSVDTRLTPTAYAISPTDGFRLRLSLAADIRDFELTTLAAGDYAATIGFLGTATFLGFSVWEDEDMTRAVTSGLQITDELGQSVSIIDPDGSGPPDPAVPEPGTLGVLCLGLVCLGITSRRRRRPA